MPKSSKSGNKTHKVKPKRLKVVRNGREPANGNKWKGKKGKRK